MANCTTNKIVVMISGNGTNLQALIDCQDKYLYSIALVISNVADAYGLKRAEKAGISSLIIDHRHFENRLLFEEKIIQTIDEINPKLIVLAGFMRIISPEMASHFIGRIINIHPSLLPKYKGLNTYKRVLENNEKEHGSTVHFVNANLDGGPIIMQTKVVIEKNDTIATLKERVQKKEHKILPLSVHWFLSNKVKMVDNKTVLSGNVLDSHPLSSSKV